MKIIKNFEEWNSSNLTEKNDAKNVEIFNKQKNKVINQNKEYNFDAIPKGKFKDKDPNYDIVHSNKIEIGDPNPVKKFKEWSGKYWRKKKDRYKKYES